MRLRLTVLAALATLLVLAGPAGAATRIGNTCTASGAGAALIADPPLGTAAADGVITSWGVGFPTPGAYTSELVVLTPAGANNWTIAQVTGTIALITGLNATAARIPIKAGQLIAQHGTPSATLCPATTTTAIQGATPSLAVGSAVTTAAVPAMASATIWADIEPDGDGDGYGDETQDGCPQSAKFQVACPKPKLGAVIAGTSRSFQAWVTTDFSTTASAKGSVKLPSAAAAKTVTFKSKSVKTAPGSFTKVTLKYPSSLRRALSKLRSSQKLTLKVTLSADGVLLDGTKKFTLRLRGTR